MFVIYKGKSVVIVNQLKRNGCAKLVRLCTCNIKYMPLFQCCQTVESTCICSKMSQSIWNLPVIFNHGTHPPTTVSEKEFKTPHQFCADSSGVTITLTIQYSLKILVLKIRSYLQTSTGFFGLPYFSAR